MPKPPMHSASSVAMASTSGAMTPTKARRSGRSLASRRSGASSVVTHAIDEVVAARVAFLLDQTVHVRIEAGEGVVELAREAQEVDDLAVEALARNQQRNAGRIRCEQRCRDAPFQLVDGHALGAAVRDVR